MTKEITKQETTEMAVFNDNDFDQAGSDQKLSSKDIMIPKILVMQGQSPMVLEGDAMFGELRDSLNKEVMAKAKMGDKDALPITCIPFHRECYWIIKKQVGEKWQTVMLDKFNKENENLNQYETWQGEDGNYKRVLLLLFYIHIPGKVIPYTIGFKGSSLETGKALSTQMYVVNKSLNVDKAYLKSPMGKIIELTPKKVSKNDNTYIVVDMTVKDDSTYEQACEAMKWYKAVSSGETTADHSDELNPQETQPNGEF